MKNLKKSLLLASLLMLLTSTAFAYVGNSSSHKFHYEGCRAEQKSAQITASILILVKRPLKLGTPLVGFADRNITCKDFLQV